MSSLVKTLFATALLASAVVATDHGDSNYGSNYGGGNYGGGSGDEWSEWENHNKNVDPASATCPVGCIPIPTGGPPPAKPGEVIVQVVSVADQNGSLKYFPDSIDAPVGSIVQFQFHPKNHTITESSFDEPCKPLNDSLKTDIRPGVKSGFVPVLPNAEFTPVYNVLINDTKPIWIYCGQVNHCQRGMAMVINQNKTSTEKTIQKYIENAGKIPIVSAAAPPAGGPPGYSAPPPAAPPSSTTTATFGASPPSSSPPSGPPAPAVQTVAASTPVRPATFTGAANVLNARDVPAFAGLALGGMFALW